MLQSITAAFSLIAISELGDKSFFIAMILAMRHPKGLVFAGVMTALAGMTVISVLMGHMLSMLPRIYVHIVAIGLFLFFGVKLLYDGWRMPTTATQTEIAAAKSTVDKADSHLINQQAAWPIFLEALSTTFVTEWGDRTQIATVTLAATNDALGVTVGATLGHALCTLIAVVGGSLIAGKISERMITLIGGTLFIIVGLVSWWEGV
jgi:putative Ca2+/H+ antiporter (TMEM165/GDT1 family)